MSRHFARAKQPRIALLGLFGVGNLGNDSTYESTRANLRQRLANVEVLCVTPAPESARAIFGDLAISFDPGPEMAAHPTEGRFARIVRRASKEVRQWAPSYRLLRTLDQLVIAGTGAFDDFGLSPMGIPYRLFRWSILAWLSRTPVIVLSSGVGPIRNRLSRFFMLAALRLAKVRSYRDTVSRDYLESVGFRTKGDAVLPDLVFAIPEGSLPAYSEPAHPPRTVGLGVMGYYGWQNSPTHGEETFQTYVQKIEAFALWLIDRGNQVCLIYGEPAADRRAVDAVLAASASLAQPAATMHCASIERGADVFAALSEVDIVVATRFHNVVYALMLGRPALSISYARKNDVLLQEMGLGDYHLPIESFDLEALKALFLDLAQNDAAGHSQIRAQIRTTSHRYRVELERYFDDLWGVAPVSQSVALNMTEELI